MNQQRDVIPLKGYYRTEAGNPGNDSKRPGFFMSLWAVLALLAARLFPRSSVRTTLLSLTSIGSLALFFKLMDEVHEQGQGTTLFDRTVLTYLHQHSNTFLDGAARLCATLGSLEGLGLVTLLGMTLGWRIAALRPAIRVMPVAALVSLALLTAIKFSIHRTRPDLFPALFDATGYSFPSGHAFLSLVLYGLLGYYLLHLPDLSGLWRWCVSLFTLLLILSIGLSRAYAGVHYPSDVLGGCAAGVPCLYVFVLWSKWLAERTGSLNQGRV